MVTKVDIVIPAYNERSEAIETTLIACLNQTYPASKIFLVDDCSREPILLPESCQHPKIQLIRFEFNQGISIARNTAIQKSSATYIACINIDVLPEPDWVHTCMKCLDVNPTIGACFTKIVPHHGSSLLSKWRVRFHEQKYGATSGIAHFAPGHAVLFRRKAIELVGGYTNELRRTHEDADICFRMREKGLETYYTIDSFCISIQEDSLSNLTYKQLIRDGFDIDKPFSLHQLIWRTTRSLFNRLARNLIKGRLYFIPVDLMIYSLGILSSFKPKNH
ncbi:glycosyltransferase [Lyngbya confervoides]|uniref:Glycosyltransferase n=1 Tax=Lyngbya confervoides BDU141951 TaxID=1574623 RepID=A0ABD4T7Q0_9CYAN|nr:glycosyltransferase family 2 protein [Lyngbya confervoides]MCM1984607.1 glycosyltransferase [Lyngbya confervoides BDU141951]